MKPAKLSLDTSAEQRPSGKKRAFSHSTVLMLLAFCMILSSTSCITTRVDPIKRINDAWLAENGGELFRVVMMSDGYYVSQKSHTDRIERLEDSGGDQFFMERLKKYDIVDRETEGMIRIQLYPDSGRLMKVRFLQSTYITEIDKMITDDIQRWSFKFNGPVSPTSFSIRYRIVLRQRESADDKEIQAELDRKKRRR